jgi:hypothetical protein
MQIWQPQPSLRIASAVVGVVAGLAAVILAGVAVVHSEWGGAALALLLGSLLVIPALAVAFYVRLAFNGQQLIYRSANPGAVEKDHARAVQLIRFGSVNALGFPSLRIVDAQGLVLLSAPCVWSDQQVSEIAKTLGLPLERI